MKRNVNGFIIETIGGFITVKQWIVSTTEGKFMGNFFTFKAAKKACLDNDFSSAFNGRLY